MYSLWFLIIVADVKCHQMWHLDNPKQATVCTSVEKDLDFTWLNCLHFRSGNVHCSPELSNVLVVDRRSLERWKPAVKLNHYFFNWMWERSFQLICSNNTTTCHRCRHVSERVLERRLWEDVRAEGVSKWCHDIPAWLVCPQTRRINEWAELACHSVIGAHTHTTIAFSLTRSVVQEGFNLPLLSHRAWHSVERSLFRESIRSKIKLVPSAPSPLASRHKADDYQLEPARLQRTTGASQPATKISTAWIWKLLTSCRLPVFHLFL